MAPYRTQTKIIADILTTARDMNTGGDGVGITMLLRKGNVSYSRMTKLITDLVGAGLLVELRPRKECQVQDKRQGPDLPSRLRPVRGLRAVVRPQTLKTRRFADSPPRARRTLLRSNFYPHSPLPRPDNR